MTEDKTKQEEKKAIDFSKYLIEEHDKKCREVRSKDIKTVISDSHIMYNITHSRIGIYNGLLAVAHSQINKKKPLRFFVTFDKQIIINPVIINHTKMMVDSEEGCGTFPDNYLINVQRWNKCEVKYQTLTDDGKLSDFIEKGVSGKESKMFQHEIDHMDGIYIFKAK